MNIFSKFLLFYIRSLNRLLYQYGAQLCTIKVLNCIPESLLQHDKNRILCNSCNIFVKLTFPFPKPLQPPPPHPPHVKAVSEYMYMCVRMRIEKYLL